jgi:hypothetical protein
MDDFFAHDLRIEENTALRDLERKVHWLMYQLAQSGLALDLNGGSYSFPDDLNKIDVQNDAMAVAKNAQHDNKLTAGCGALQNNQYK